MTPSVSRSASRSRISIALSWVLPLAAILWVLTSLHQPARTIFRIRDFGRLPAQSGGRIQPFDSLARNSLLQIRHKQGVAWTDVAGSHKLDATTWLLEVMMKPEIADTRLIFRIDNPELLGWLRLPETEKHFSFNQLTNMLGEIERQSARIGGIDAAHRTPFERQVADLHSSLLLYERLKFTLLQPDAGGGFLADLLALPDALPAGIAALRASELGQPFDTNTLRALSRNRALFEEMDDYALAGVVPPTASAGGGIPWQSAGANLSGAISGQPLSPAVMAYARMASAYRHDQPGVFNKTLDEHQAWLERTVPDWLTRTSREHFFNFFQPFYKAMILYVLVFLIACLSWFTTADWVRRSALGLAGVAAVLHTAGILFRMYLEGRPPITNLYSSAVFVGWAGALLGIVMERMQRDGLGVVISAVTGFVTLIIAHNLALGGDTMESLRAVLDTNFWLATHVVTVTLGYAATFVAGGFAAICILRGRFTRQEAEAGRNEARMVYGILCFGTLFSFVGTVLGGIWADQSWGRFWGWDPKENGALMIVLWNAAILHARKGGMIRERGLFNMAVFGNIVTSFSWFGVNMLGVGLHSYGFMESGFRWLLAFAATQLAVIAIGLLPGRRNDSPAAMG